MTFGWYDGRRCRSTWPTRRMSFCSPLWLMPSAAPDASAKAVETMHIENLDVVMDSSVHWGVRGGDGRPGRSGMGDRLRRNRHATFCGFEFILRAAAASGVAEDEIHERRPGVVTRLHPRCHNVPSALVLVLIMDSRTTVFTQNRPRLYGIAYRMLGSRADAEDMLQEAYLRWHRSDPERVQTPQAWLVTTVTRLCIDRLRAARTEREAYVGPWLPEPLIGESPPADRGAELASDLSVAFLVVLERLAPEERAAFLLHDVFDCEYAEIARILGKSETACRQIVHRAREHVRRERPRFHVSEAARAKLLERFVAALRAQDHSALLALFAQDATWTSDGGGKTKAARKVVK